MKPPRSRAKIDTAQHRNPRPRRRALLLLSALLLLPPLCAPLIRPRGAKAKSEQPHEQSSCARLSERVGVRASGRGRPLVRLNDGRELIAAYTGAGAARQALAAGDAAPRALAAADFDEDGTPDLVSGYAADGAGLLTLHRGNVDAVYPHAPEAQQRKAAGQFTDAPFLSPAAVFQLPAAPDFLGAGDFDGDGHWDVLAAARGDKALYLLAGDGRGDLRLTKRLELPGALTALATADINRRDGLTDVLAGVVNGRGARALVFAGPHGALQAAPESIKLPAPARAFAAGHFDERYETDFAVAAGRELLVVHGRDRRDWTDVAALRADVPAPRLDRYGFAGEIRALAAGDFDADGQTDLALLFTTGELQLFTRRAATGEPAARAAGGWHGTPFMPGNWTGATELLSARVSASAADDLLLLDDANRQLHVVAADTRRRSSTAPAAPRRVATALDVTGTPVAVLPMRLDADALTDLVVLRSGVTAPTVALTAPRENDANAAAFSPQFATFSNTTSINITSSFSPPDKATPYPSNINVSGQSGLIDKVRVRLNNLSGSSSEGLDVMVVGPAGQKALLMSDIGSCCVISNATLTFADDAQIALGNIRIISGTYLPSEAPNTPDTFPAPAPAGPYATTLSTFNGTDPNGTWSLYAVNDSFFGSFNGQIAGGWTLYFGDPLPTTFVVTNTNDSGAGSLRQAILDANANFGADIINFQIGSGPQTIAPTSPLPNITEAVTIDGTSQPGYAGTPVVEVDGVNAGSFAGQIAGGLFLKGGRSVVRGLLLTRFENSAVAMDQGTDNIIEGNFIGTNFGGTAAKGNFTAITIESTGNLVGGTSAAARNLISGNTSAVLIGSSGLAGNLVQGNFIGTDVTGTLKLSNTYPGVDTNLAPGSPNNTVGGTTAGARNVIGGGTFGAVELSYTGSQGNLIQGNYLGVNVNGTGAVANGEGVEMDSGAQNNTVGGTTAAARNIISGNTFGGVQLGQSISNSGSASVSAVNLVQGNYIGTKADGASALANGFAGVRVPANADNNQVVNNRIAFNNGDGVQITNTSDPRDTPGIEEVIYDNEIFANTDLGIDLGASGITPNDPQDTDGGANLQQNFPVLTSIGPPAEPPGGADAPEAISPQATVTVNGTLNSTPNATFFINWFFSTDQQCTNNQPATRPLAYGKLGPITSDGQGNAPFSFPFSFPPGVTSGVINATATDAQNNTSEFSACLPVVSPPPGTLQFGAATFSAGEGGGGALITVTRAGGSGGAVSVAYATANGSATAGSDYTGVSGTLAWADGDAAAKSFSVPITNDQLVEGNETVNLTLSNPTGGATLGTQTTAVLTIVDDDQASLRIDTLSRAAGQTTGGQSLMLTGSFAGLSSVTLGGVNAAWDFTHAGGDVSSVTVITPPHAVGAADIVLTPTAGSTYTKPNAFAYLPATFTDDTLVIGVTPMRAQHVTELRQAADALRAVAGLPAAQWTDPVLLGVPVKAAHVTELRAYLEQAAQALGYPAAQYTDPALVGVPIKRVHIEELRQRVRAIAG